MLRDLAARIRTQREKRGLTQSEVAQALEISPQAVSKWERGENAPDISQLVPLGELLDVSIDWLLGRRSAPGELSYEKAGVSIDTAMAAKARMAEILATQDARVLTEFRSFASAIEPAFPGYESPVLVLKTDEPGSKQLLAFQHGRIGGIGHDLVNHLVNDLLAVGALPVAAVDTILCGHLERDTVVEIVASIAEACGEQDCLLLGGETSEQPGVLPDGSYMLCATMLGVAEKDRLIDGSRIEPGDLVLCLPSNGVHTNGYSLIRKLLELDPALRDRPVDDEAFLQTVLRPHQSYYPCLKDALSMPGLHGIAHITGGGIRDNLARVLPERTGAQIDLDAIRVPAVFGVIREAGRIPDSEMLRTFNVGVGMAVVVAASEAEGLREHLAAHDCHAYAIGEIVAGDQSVVCEGALNW